MTVRLFLISFEETGRTTSRSLPMADLRLPPVFAHACPTLGQPIGETSKIRSSVFFVALWLKGLF